MTKLETPIFIKREEAVAAKVAQRWKFQWGRMGGYSPYDVYFLKENRLAAIAEIRTRRDRQLKTFPTVPIDLDKWFTLVTVEIALNLPGLYIIACTDAIWFLRIGRLPIRRCDLQFMGRNDRPQASNDQCPVVLVPSAWFTWVADSNGVFEDLKTEEDGKENGK